MQRPVVPARVPLGHPGPGHDQHHQRAQRRPPEAPRHGAQSSRSRPRSPGTTAIASTNCPPTNSAIANRCRYRTTKWGSSLVCRHGIDRRRPAARGTGRPAARRDAGGARHGSSGGDRGCRGGGGTAARRRREQPGPLRGRSTGRSSAAGAADRCRRRRSTFAFRWIATRPPPESARQGAQPASTSTTSPVRSSRRCARWECEGRSERRPRRSPARAAGGGRLLRNRGGADERRPLRVRHNRDVTVPPEAAAARRAVR